MDWWGCVKSRSLNKILEGVSEREKKSQTSIFGGASCIIKS